MSIRLYAMHCGAERTDMSCFDPFDEKVGTKVEIPYFLYVIRHPEGTVVFDTGGHPAYIDDARSRLGDLVDSFDIRMRPGDDLVSKLASLGLAPEEIAHVAMSHLHYDHAGGLSFLREAIVHVQHKEMVFAHWPPVYQRALYVPADFPTELHWHEIEGEHDLFNDGTLWLFPTPGHTPGHQSLLVKLPGQAVILVGDAAYLPEKMAARILPGIVWHADAMIASWERIEELQRRHDAVVLMTHDLGWESATRLGPDAWYE